MYNVVAFSGNFSFSGDRDLSLSTMSLREIARSRQRAERKRVSASLGLLEEITAREGYGQRGGEEIILT